MSVHYIFKILTLGGYCAGKTCIITRFVDGIFHGNQLPTIGIDYKTKYVELANGKKAKLLIWDTAGPEYINITRKYFKGANGIILIYDITNKDSFKKVYFYINEIKENGFYEGIPIFLVGNKIDEEYRRVITFEEGARLAKEHGFMFCECSVKTGENIDFIFNKLINEMQQKFEENEINNEEPEKIEEEKEKQLKRIESEEKQKKICANLLKYLSF